APRRGRSVAAWAAGAAALAFLVGLAVWPLLGPALQPHLPDDLQDPTAARVGELEARLAALESRPAPATAAEQLDPLASRVEALERDVQALAARPEPQPQTPEIDPRLIERLDRVEAGLARLDRLEAGLQQTDAVRARLAEVEAAL